MKSVLFRGGNRGKTGCRGSEPASTSGLTMRTLISKLSPWFWGLSGGLIALYLFGLLMGVFNPAELWGWTVLVAVLLVLSLWHAAAVRRALREGDPELRRTMGKARESRGF
jgi:hypothetical protein